MMAVARLSVRQFCTSNDCVSAIVKGKLDLAEYGRGSVQQKACLAFVRSDSAALLDLYSNTYKAVWCTLLRFIFGF